MDEDLLKGMEGGTSKPHEIPIPSATEIVEQETGISPSQRFQSSTRISESTEEVEQHKKHRKWRRVRRKKVYVPTEIGKVPGVMKIVISNWVQKLLNCVVGEHVTGEYPWKYVKKEELEDNLELHDESSEFLPFREEITVFPREEMLMVYIPDEMRDYDEFYICLTEEAEDGALKIINAILEEREERLNNSVWRTARDWETLGSGPEVDILQIVNNRPLLEVEIESNYPIKSTKPKFTERLVDQVRDGYAELITTRRTFENIERRTLEIGIQATPTWAERGTQTEYFSRNASTQYEFKYPVITELSKKFQDNMQDFLDNKINKLADTLTVNDHIDFYKDDYVELVKDKKYTSAPVTMRFKPYTFFSHPNTCKGKEIVCHSWHPIWSGIVAIAYATHKTCDYRPLDFNEDVVINAMYNTTPVLLWSFQDHLDPKLYLDTYSEITCLSWCPYIAELLIGGCDNGQVILWDISDQLQKVEETIVLTPTEERYKNQMNRYMRWMKNTKDLNRVRPTFVSDLEYSHKGVVTSIRWLTPYREITKSGQIKDIPPEEGRESLQFMTGSLDGTVMAWDMHSKPPSYTTSYRPKRKLRRLKERPIALEVASSPYSVLNRVFRPIFKVNVIAPNTNRLLPLTEFNIRVAPTDYVEKNPNPKRKFKLTDRVIFEANCRRPIHPCINQIVAGSVEGDFIVASWEGFDYNSGEVVNKETCKLENFGHFHDGPVVAISRSELFPDLILTVGGKVFAIWKKNFIGKPVLWRKSHCRYNHGVWNSLRPATFRLSREDGYIEMWHLRIRSDRPETTQFISREGLGMVTTHPRKLKQNITGMVGNKGSFELFYVSSDIAVATEEDTWSTYKLCDRELDRKTNFIKWQDEWLTKHAQEVQEKKEQERLARLAKEEALKAERAQLRAEAEERMRQLSEVPEKETMPPDPGHYTEWAEKQLLEREKERMMERMLRLRKLNVKVLKKRQVPLFRLAEEDKKKKAKQLKRQNIAEKIFDENITMLFPSAIEKKPPPPPDPYAGGDSEEIKTYHFEKYMELAEEYEAYVMQRGYQYHFNWLALLASGRERRRSIEMHHNRYNHKLRLLKEKLERQQGQSSNFEPMEEPSHTSLGSIDYGMEPSSTTVDEEGDHEEDEGTEQ